MTVKKDFHSFTIGEALDKFVEGSNLKKGLTQSLIREKWKTIAGETIARYTTLLVVKDKTLSIWVSSAIVKSELVFGKTKLLELVNSELGYTGIEDIVIR